MMRNIKADRVRLFKMATKLTMPVSPTETREIAEIALDYLTTCEQEQETNTALRKCLDQATQALAEKHAAKMKAERAVEILARRYYAESGECPIYHGNCENVRAWGHCKNEPVACLVNWALAQKEKEGKSDE